MAKKKKLNNALLITTLALLINIITASIYIFQASIMRDEQHASVWPHVEWAMSYIQGSGFKLTVKNNGVGPALIKNTSMQFNGNKVDNLGSLFEQAIETQDFPHVYGAVDNRVIAPGESIVLINVGNNLWSEMLYNQLVLENDFTYQIYYESIYGQKWVCNGFEVEELEE